MKTNGMIEPGQNVGLFVCLKLYSHQPPLSGADDIYMCVLLC